MSRGFVSRMHDCVEWVTRWRSMPILSIRSIRSIRSILPLLPLVIFVMQGSTMPASASVLRAGEFGELRPLKLNTKEDEFGVAFSADGRTMYFTAETAGRQRIMKCDFDGGECGPASEVNVFPAGRVRNVGMPAISSDGHYMVFAAMLTDMSGYGRTDLFSARKVNGSWKDIRNLGATVNSSGWDSHPSLSSDGSTLYFASDRDDGLGGTDIYRCTRVGSSWSKAEAVRGLNSAADDFAPCISPDMRTLYFVSNRTGGIGGYDVYAGVIDADSICSVRLLSEPVNTKANEYGFSIAVSGNTIAVASDRAAVGVQCDLYVGASLLRDPAMTLLRGELVRGELLPGELIPRESGADDFAGRGVSWITIHSLDDNRSDIDVRVDDQTRTYTAVLSPGHAYAVTSWETESAVPTRVLRIDNTEQGTVRSVNLNAIPCADGARLVLPISLVESGAVTNALTHLELRRLAELMLAHPELRVSVIVRAPDADGDSSSAVHSAKVDFIKSMRTILNLRGIPFSSVLDGSGTAEEAREREVYQEGSEPYVVVYFHK